MRTVLIIVVALVLGTAGVLFLLGRGKVGVTGAVLRPPGAGAEARIMTLRLYFGDPKGSGLTREDRAILAGGSRRERLQACIRELAAGPTAGGVAAVPPATRLREVFVDQWGLGYLDFDAGLLGRERPGDYEEWLAVAAIVRTVCDNFPDIREIRFMIEGQVVTSLDGYIDLEEPLGPEQFPVGPRAGGL